MSQTGDRHAERVGGFGRARRESERCAGRASVATGWAIPKPDAVFTMPAAFDSTRKGNDRLSVYRDSHGLDGRQMGADGGGAARVLDPLSITSWSISASPESSGCAARRSPAFRSFLRATTRGKPRNDIGGGGSDILTIYTPGNVSR